MWSRRNPRPHPDDLGPQLNGIAGDIQDMRGFLEEALRSREDHWEALRCEHPRLFDDTMETFSAFLREIQDMEEAIRRLSSEVLEERSPKTHPEDYLPHPQDPYEDPPF